MKANARRCFKENFEKEMAGECQGVNVSKWLELSSIYNSEKSKPKKFITG